MIEEKKKNDTYYYLDILSHIEKEASLFGYRILTEYYDYHNFDVPKCIQEHHAAGVIILGKVNDQMIYLLRLYIEYILCVNHSVPYMNIDNITTNDFLGGYLACEYLIKKGYKSIGFVGEIESSKNFKRRFQGYRQCMINYFHPKKVTLLLLQKV